MHSRIGSLPSNQKEAGSIGPVNRSSESAVAEPEPTRSVGRRAVGRVGDAFAFRPDRVTVIRPAARWPRLDFRELWHFRELLGRFVWRDVKVRYKQTLIGIACPSPVRNSLLSGSSPRYFVDSLVPCPRRTRSSK